MDLRYLIASKVVYSEPRQFTRYLATGGVAWLVDVGVFVLCLESFGVILAQVAARLSGAAVAFFGHKIVVFRQLDYQSKTFISQMVRYTLLWIFALCVSTLALVVLIDHSPLDPVIAKIMVEIGIVLLNYLVMRSLIFRNDDAPDIKE